MGMKEALRESNLIRGGERKAGSNGGATAGFGLGETWFPSCALPPAFHSSRLSVPESVESSDMDSSMQSAVQGTETR